MTQMKKKSPKSTKKQSTKVQLSKQDLTELLMVLKDFLFEEISIQHKRLFLNQSMMEKRITSLEIIGNNHRNEIRILKQGCIHKYNLNRFVYSKTTGNLLVAVYMCNRCKKELHKNWFHMSRKEKKVLRKLGVKTL